MSHFFDHVHCQGIQSIQESSTDRQTNTNIYNNQFFLQGAALEITDNFSRSYMYNQWKTFLDSQGSLRISWILCRILNKILSDPCQHP